MDLRKRLAALDRSSRKPDAGLKNDSATAEKSVSSEKSLISKLQLVPYETKAGIVWARDYSDVLHFPQGALPDLSEVMTGAKLASPALEDIFFLDTETTGLAGGTGTLAFLIGCSWFKDGLFHTRQLFLPGPGLESALLKELEKLAQGFTVIMTFNGGSFDLPLLRTRALMNRVADPLAHLVSWDLLMAGRRLWGKQLPNCRQQTLEKSICSIKRSTADIEGALIPQTWFDFVSTGQTEDMEKVLYHNYRDMMGMGSIFGKVVTQISFLAKGNQALAELSWQECWSLGRICEKKKNQLAAEFWLLAALTKSTDQDPELPHLIALYQDGIRILKRSGNWDVVGEVVNDALALGLTDSWLNREAAILFEHRLVDLSLALDYALRAEDPHRVARLQRKLSSGR